MMSSAQAAQHAHGMEIGGHDEPSDFNLSEDEARREIGEGKDKLEAIVKERIRFCLSERQAGKVKAEQVGMVRDLGFRRRSLPLGASHVTEAIFYSCRDLRPGIVRRQSSWPGWSLIFLEPLERCRLERLNDPV